MKKLIYTEKDGKKIIVRIKKDELLGEALNRLAAKAFGSKVYFFMNRGLNDHWDENGGRIFGQFVEGQSCLTCQVGVDFDVT